MDTWGFDTVNNYYGTRLISLVCETGYIEDFLNWCLLTMIILTGQYIAHVSALGSLYDYLGNVGKVVMKDKPMSIYREPGEIKALLIYAGKRLTDYNR